MICYFSSQGIPILLQKNGTLFVLAQAIMPEIVPLCRNEISGPEDDWQEVVNAHNFCLHGTFCVDILFCGANDWESTPQR